jgi:condensin complex subunit 2
LTRLFTYLFVQEESSQRGVNFQKASCTLDASVKIYSHRVDDTHASSHRILESLSRNGNFDDIDDETDADGNRRAAKVGSKSQSNRLNIAETIERNVDNINSKVEKQQAVDPMFHKLSKAFDEGGAKGMLMTNMRVSATSCSLAFDSSKLFSSEKKESDVGSSEKDCGIASTSNASGACYQLEYVDISDIIHKSGITAKELYSMSICPYLDTYRETLGIQASSTGTFDAALFHEYFDASLFAAPPAVAAVTTVISDHGPANSIDDDCVDEAYYDNGDYGSDNEIESHKPMFTSLTPSKSPAATSAAAKRQSLGAKIHWDTVFTNEDDAVTSAVPFNLEMKDDDEQMQVQNDEEVLAESSNRQGTLFNDGIVAGSDYSFFDVNVMSKNNAWAGARHWKYATRSLNKTTTVSAVAAAENKENTPSPEESSDAGQTTSADTKAVESVAFSKQSKPKFKLEFTSSRLDESVFAPPKGRSDTTVMTNAAVEKSLAARDDGTLLLPMDVKIQTKDLARLYLCPQILFPPPLMTKMLLAMPKNMQSTWRQSRFMAIPSSSTMQGDMIWNESELQTKQGPQGILTVSNAAVFSETNMVNDDYDGGDDEEYYHNDDMDMAPSSESVVAVPVKELKGLDIDTDKLLQATRKVEKVDIGYASIAKRVNVRKLKTDIWSEIDKETSSKAVIPVDSENAVADKKKEKAEKQVAPTISFQDLISDIAVKQQQKEVSLPFYFICLLHLANEKTLKIDSPASMDDLFISKDV